ncbi:MAG: DUF4102 domain-containing protein [Clostridia bacterium]|nr:DUF4102 domain-containing protein [Clostridia bacterium]
MLTDAKVRNAKQSTKILRLYDTGGLYLEVASSGGKWRRLKYRFGGKEKRLSLGTYPEVGLARARERRDEARKLLAEGVDPGIARKQEQAKTAEEALTFELVAREWYEQKLPTWTPGTAARIKRRLEVDLLPPLGSLPAKSVAPRDILTAIRAIEARGAAETTKCALQDVGQVFRYAVSSGLVDLDPCPSLRGAVLGRPVEHHASVTEPRAVGALLRALWGYEGTPMTAAALKLAAYTFVRLVNFAMPSGWSST